MTRSPFSKTLVPSNEQLLLAAPRSEAAGSLRSPAALLMVRRSRIAGVDMTGHLSRRTDLSEREVARGAGGGFDDESC